MKIKRLLCAALAAIGATGVGGATAASAATLTGAGATPLAPLASIWAQGFQNATGNVVTYNPAGTAAGVEDASGGKVDFGASDAPLQAFSGECSGCQEIPFALTAVGVGYNIPGVGDTPGTEGSDALRLTGALLAKIYLGQITSWNDPAIVNLNKGLALPKLKITPIWRQDPSGDTYAFANFLSDVSKPWATSKGYAASIAFGVGLSAIGDAGVATLVRLTPGAIGYISAGQLLSERLGSAALENAAGTYEQPRPTSIDAAAAAVATIPAGGLSIVDPPRSEKTAYPISAFTYAIVPKSPEHVSLLQSFLSFAVTSGREMGIGAGFAPLPAAVESGDETLIGAL